MPFLSSRDLRAPASAVRTALAAVVATLRGRGRGRGVGCGRRFALVGALRLVGPLGLVGLVGCGGEAVATHEAETEPARLYMALRLDQRAINLATTAPANTLQLVATPRDGRDSVLRELPAPTFRLATPGDAAVLAVTPEGQLTALGASSNPIEVIAELVAPGPVRHADTARVSITADPPAVLDRVSIEPVSPNSALWPIGTSPSFGFLIPDYAPPPPLAAQSLDSAGQPIGGLVVEYVSLDPTRATVGRWTGTVTPRRPGPVRVVARTTAYGVTKADTARYTVSWARAAGVLSTTSPAGTKIFEPDEVRIVPNGVVFWSNLLGAEVDVTFDHPTLVADPVAGAPGPIGLCIFLPTACGAGNMLLPASMEGADFAPGLRRFPVPGVYPYHSTHTGAIGRIIVTNELPAEAVVR